MFLNLVLHSRSEGLSISAQWWRGAVMPLAIYTNNRRNADYYRGEKGEEKVDLDVLNADGWSKKMAGLFSCAEQKVHGRDI